MSVEVGSRWKWTAKHGMCGHEITIEDGAQLGDFVPAGGLVGRYEDGSLTGWFMADYLTQRATFLGTTPIPPVTRWKVGQQWRRSDGSIWTVDHVDDKGVGMHENGVLVHDGQLHSQWSSLDWANDRADGAMWTLITDALPRRLLVEKHIAGVPITALQLIQSRKPPEPWIPSVDDWDLLPDAGR